MIKRLMGFAFSVTILVAMASASFAWTTPTHISDPAYDCQWPKVATGLNGSMHIVYRHRIDWRIAYRMRNADGSYTPIEYPVPNHFQDQPDIIQDAQGRPHIFYTAGPGRWPENYTEIYETYKQNGTWITNQISNTATWHEGYCRAVVDSHGNIHLVYVKLDLNKGTAATVCYRKWDGASWSAETALGPIENLYFHSPDICVDSADNLHVVFVSTGGSRNIIQYCKFNGTSWTSPTVIGMGVGSTFMNYPKVAAATPNNIVAVVADDNQGTSPALIKCITSSNGGANWSTYQTLNSGGYPSLQDDGHGTVYFAYGCENTTTTGYRKWNGSAWTYPSVITGATIWQLSPDIGLDTNGNAHVVFENHVVPGSIHYISHTMEPQDSTPPSAPSFVTDDGASSDISTFIHATWGASVDPDSSINTYEYSLGSSPGATDVLGWTSVGNVLQTTGNAFIPTGITCYVNVRAINGQGVTGFVASSDGIRITAVTNAYTFAALTTVSTSVVANDTAMLARSGDGGLNLVFRDNNYGASRIVYRKCSPTGTWGSVEYVTSGSPVTAYPDVCEDTNGKVHVVYTNSTGRETMDVFEAVRASGAWSSSVNLSNNNTMDWYPYITAGTNGQVWLVGNGNTTSYAVKAAKYTGSWSPFSNLGTSFRYGLPDVACGSDGVAHMVWVQGTVLYYSKNTGSGWSSPSVVDNVSGSQFVRLACDKANNPVIVWLGDIIQNVGYPIYFTRWNGSSWSQRKTIAYGHYPVVAVDAANRVHVAYTYQFGNTNTDDTCHMYFDGSVWSTSVNLSNNKGSSIRPAIEVLPGGTVHVAWQDSTRTASTILYARGTYPRASVGVDAAKDQADGTMVDMAGKDITAVFADEGVIYVQDQGRGGSGMRVAASTSGFGPGDRVNVTGGILDTTKPNGTDGSERQVVGGLVTRLSTGDKIVPLGMRTAWVGGGANAYIAGSNSGVGLNNIGLFVAVTGRVTKRDGDVLFVDDGCEVFNVFTDGTERTGVMVKCAVVPTVSEGDFVSVVGIAEGSFPSGWSVNRRYIRCRLPEDVKKLN